jgi:hypothetical protein
MRQRWAAGVVGVTLVLALVGCGRSAGVDGDLVDDWKPIGAPVVFTPAVDSCHQGYDEISFLSAYRPVGCDQVHRAETFHIGTFTGVGDRVTPPPDGGPEVRAAFAECEAKAGGFLGGDWRAARLWLGISTPSSFGWTGGARWFRCELAEIEDLIKLVPIDRTGTLKGALAQSTPLALGCFEPKPDRDGFIQSMPPIDCATPHRSEFVGTYTAPDATAADLGRNSERVELACLDVVAGYAGIPKDRTLEYRAGVHYFWPGERDWGWGNHGVRCFLWMGEFTVTGSVKNVGVKGLPTR